MHSEIEQIINIIYRIVYSATVHSQSSEAATQFPALPYELVQYYSISMIFKYKLVLVASNDLTPCTGIYPVPDEYRQKSVKKSR